MLTLSKRYSNVVEITLTMNQRFQPKINVVSTFTCYLGSGSTNNFSESGRGLGHVTPTIFGIRSNISVKLLELETSNLIHGFVGAMLSRRTDKFP